MTFKAGSLTADSQTCSDVKDCYGSVLELGKVRMDNGQVLNRSNLDTCQKSSTESIVDLKNGYLLISCPSLVNQFEVAVFNSAAGPITLIETELGGSICSTRAYRLNAGRGWQDVSALVFPSISEQQIVASYRQRFGDYQELKPDGNYAAAQPFTKELLQANAHSSYCFRLPRVGTRISARSYLDHPKYYDQELFGLDWDKQAGVFNLITEPIDK